MSGVDPHMPARLASSQARMAPRPPGQVPEAILYCIAATVVHFMKRRSRDNIMRFIVLTLRQDGNDFVTAGK